MNFYVVVLWFSQFLPQKCMNLQQCTTSIHFKLWINLRTWFNKAIISSNPREDFRPKPSTLNWIVKFEFHNTIFLIYTRIEIAIKVCLTVLKTFCISENLFVPVFVCFCAHWGNATGLFNGYLNNIVTDDVGENFNWISWKKKKKNTIGLRRTNDFESGPKICMNFQPQFYDNHLFVTISVILILHLMFTSHFF